MISMGNSLSVLPPRNQLDSRTDLLRQSLRGASCSVRDQPLREAFGNDVLHLLSDEFIAAVAELLSPPARSAGRSRRPGLPPPWHPALPPRARGTFLPSELDASPHLFEW